MAKARGPMRAAWRHLALLLAWPRAGALSRWRPALGEGVRTGALLPPAAVPTEGGGLLERGGGAYQAFVDRYPTLLDDNLRNSQARQMPRFMRLFDWVVGLPHCQDPKLGLMITSDVPNCWPSELDHSRAIGAGDPYANQVEDPRTVLVDVFRLGDMIDYAETHLNSSREDRVLLIASDLNISFVAKAFGETPEEVVADVRRYFRTVWMVGPGAALPGLGTFPTPLRDLYLRDGAAEAAAEAIALASVAPRRKRERVLAAWGAFSLDLEADCDTPRHESNRFACESRRGARLWAASPAAARARVEVLRTTPDAYWRELAGSRFLLCPLGQGIQVPKMVEALLVLTIPIVQRGGFTAHDDLVRMGFPIAVVDAWDEVTPARLGAWWRELAPRLERFRRNCLTTDSYWMLLTGSIQQCE